MWWADFLYSNICQDFFLLSAEHAKKNSIHFMEPKVALGLARSVQSFLLWSLASELTIINASWKTRMGRKNP